MTIGAYQDTPAFAYPGWRLTVPGGPAGGHYKGFTHNYSAGTAIEAGDEYEADRAAGASSHDAVHASPRNPRGVYRSSGEVPPRPNASGSAQTYRGFQTRRHAGTSVAPGSFPAPFDVTGEDAFLAAHPGMGDLGYINARMVMSDGWSPTDVAPPHVNFRVASEAPPSRPNVVADAPPYGIDVPPGYVYVRTTSPATGATNVVNQPPPALTAPAPTVNVPNAPPISPAPAPVVASPVVVPDGSGSYLRVSDGSTVSPSDVYENPATGQLQATVGAGSGISNWLTQNSIWSAVPNWTLLAGVAAVLLLSGGKGRR
jgi:hypothetical protein